MGLANILGSVVQGVGEGYESIQKQKHAEERADAIAQRSMYEHILTNPDLDPTGPEKAAALEALIDSYGFDTRKHPDKVPPALMALAKAAMSQGAPPPPLSMAGAAPVPVLQPRGVPPLAMQPTPAIGLPAQGAPLQTGVAPSPNNPNPTPPPIPTAITQAAAAPPPVPTQSNSEPTDDGDIPIPSFEEWATKMRIPPSEWNTPWRRAHFKHEIGYMQAVGRIESYNFQRKLKDVLPPKPEDVELIETVDEKGAPIKQMREKRSGKVLWSTGIAPKTPANDDEKARYIAIMAKPVAKRTPDESAWALAYEQEKRLVPDIAQAGANERQGAMYAELNPDGTVIGYFNPKTGERTGPGFEGARRQPIPAGTNQKVADYENSARKVMDLGASYNPEFVGPYKGRYERSKASGILSFMPFLQTPEGYGEFSALNADLKNSVIKLVTGAQMGVQEAQRILQQVPVESDKPELWMSKYEQTRKNVDYLLKEVKRLNAVDNRGSAAAPPPGAPNTADDYMRRKGVQ